MGTWTKTLPTTTVKSTYTGFPADMDDWSCAQWKAYYENNVAALGKTKALQIINVDSENVGMLANVHYCQYDCAWVSFFKKEGLPVNNVFSTIYCGATNTVTDVVDVANNATKTASNVTNAISSFSSSKIMVIAGIGILAYGAYHLLSSDNAKKAAKYL